MLLEQAPSYGAVSGGKGLGANYSLNFTADLTHQIPLTGAWQGDSVKALSLFINNYENNFSLTVTGGNSSKLIPAYSTGYLDISSFDSVTITSSGASTVNVSVLNYVLPYGFDARGNPPDVSNNDALFSSVKLLTHFEGINNSVNFINQLNGSIFSFISGTVLSTTQKRYGSTSAYNNNENLNSEVSLSPTVAFAAGPSCYEFSVYPETQTLSSSYVLLWTIMNSGSTDITRSFGFISNSAGDITGIFIGVNANGGTFNKQFSYAVNIPKNSWTDFALSWIDGSSGNIYINGQFVTTFSGCSFYASPSFMSFASYNAVLSLSPLKTFKGYYDELRYTSNYRYLTQSYIPAEFLNQ
jgi:hypothetical protein